MELDTIVIQLLTGLSRAAILFIVASGLSLVFGALRVVNIAHGSFFMLGAFLTVTVTSWIGGLAGFAVAMLAVPLVVAAGSTVVEFSLRRLYGREHLLQLLATFAWLLVIADLVHWLWGTQLRFVAQPTLIAGPVSIMGRAFPKYSLFLIGVALVLATVLFVLMRRTGLGRDIRAAVSDPEMLGMVGVNVPGLFTRVFALGAGLAALGGVLAAPNTSVGLGMDISIIIEAFAVVIIGGLGSLVGTAIGALVVGIVFAFGILWVPDAALVIVFAVMVGVLLWRPSGLLGVVER